MKRSPHRTRCVRGKRRGRDAGQAVTEYLMILGILTAIIIALTKMIAPAIADGMIRYMEKRVIFNSTVAEGGEGRGWNETDRGSTRRRT